MSPAITLRVVWAIAVAGLAAWTLLARAGGALIDGSSDWALARLAPLIESGRKEALVDRALTWAERLCLAGLWTVWALGSLGLALTTVFATLLLRRGRRADCA
jgi:hypothetical protein